MNYLIQPICLLALCAVQCKAQPNNVNEISKNGMTVSWKIEGDVLQLSMKAPTDGWVAIGLNSVDELAGTNLIMGCVKDGNTSLSDRYILAPGKHQSIQDLGGTSAVKLISGQELASETSLEFTLPLHAPDQWHHELKPGKKYHLLLAFSRADDFEHHSMMRTAVEISL